jgi:hypothetical protein
MNARSSLAILLAWYAVAASSDQIVGLSALAAPATQSVAQDEDESLRALLLRIEQALRKGDASGYLDLLSPSADRERAQEFSNAEFGTGATRAVIQERDRQPLDNPEGNAAYRLMLDTFVEYGSRARVATWQLDLKRVGGVEWRIDDQQRLSGVESLFRLTVDPTRQFAARNFTVRAEDLEITLLDGSVFMVKADDRVTGLVLTGRGVVRFQPTPETERAQVAIFAGSETLESRFDTAYVRTIDVNAHAELSQLVEVSLDARALRRAQDVLAVESVKTYVLDLGDLSRTPWSLLPGTGDFLLEVRTQRFGTLTYVRSGAEAEDIFVMDRSNEVNVSVYASKDRLAARGRFYGENDMDAYDVLDYDVDITYLAERKWIQGRSRMRLRTRGPLGSQLNVKLADSLAVHSVTSDKFGRLFSLRARGMNLVVVHIPEPLPAGTELTLTIGYGGRLEPQPPEREGLKVERAEEAGQPEFTVALPGEPAYLYSSRTFWYPQSPVSNFATATIRVSVPEELACLATGEPLDGFPRLIGGTGGAPRLRMFAFRADRPVRYLSFVVSRFLPVGRFAVAFGGTPGPDEANRTSEGVSGSAGPSAERPSGAGTDSSSASTSYESLAIAISATPFQGARARQLMDRAGNIAKFYQSVVGDAPYSSFSVALVDSDRPGGHSPAYFATLNQPLPDAQTVWRNDPVEFRGYPDFYLAHEMAHQWWGQAVGWNNYHEQWLSEGIAQYFAALYAERHLDDAVFERMLRQMRFWALEYSDQGPVYLGYRLGHVKDDGRIFRSLVYNKGALVLHMLRRLTGDEQFFRGIRRFYTEARYRKVGTEALRLAMEAESGRSLERFFERWIHRAALPTLEFAYRIETVADGQEVVLRITQSGDLFDVPVALTLQYADRRSVDVIVPVLDRVTDVRVKLDGRLRTVDINDDDGTLAEIRRTAF